MRVSVVVPCHNSLRWLPATLDSVLAQTFDDFEVLLIDDGGTDDLEAWTRTVGDDRVRLVRQDNAGVAAARNRGVDEAAAELVAFLDSDDLWDPRCLESLLGRFDREPELGLVYCWYDVIDAEDRPTGRVEAYDWEGEVWERFVTANPVAMSAALVPRQVFEDLGGFEVNRDRFPIDVEDWALWIRLSAKYRVGVVPEVLCHHRRHDSNSSSNTASLEAAYRHMLRQVFDGQPADRLALRRSATARVEMILGWQSLNDDRDAGAAAGFRRSAVRHHPALRRDPQYWRLGAAITAMQLLRDRGYEGVRQGSSRARQVARRNSRTTVRGDGRHNQS